MPPRIDFELSNDGPHLAPVLTLSNDVSEKEYDAIVKDSWEYQPQQARYLKVIAHNFGPIDAWHPGAGGNAWIFADEIIIE